MSLKYIAIMILSPILVTISQVLLKVGANKNGNREFIKQYLNRYVLPAYIVLGCVTIINVKIFSVLPMSYGNIIIGISYVLVSISSKFIFSESFSIKKNLGIVMTISGIIIFSIKF